MTTFKRFMDKIKDSLRISKAIADVIDGEEPGVAYLAIASVLPPVSRAAGVSTKEVLQDIEHLLLLGSELAASPVAKDGEK